jgi:hypothetical protein
MPVKLTDKVFTEAGSPVQGAVAQAILTNGTTNTITATDTTDSKGVWAFDTSIAGHQADLADPAAGYWYDVKITAGMQYRLRYGAIKAMMAMVYLAQNITLGATQLFDATLATFRLPVKTTDAATPAAGEIVLRSDTKLLRFYDGTAWQNLGNPESSYVGTVANTGVNYTVASGIMFVFCSAAVTVTLPAAATTNRPISVSAVTGNSTVTAAAGSVIGGSVNTTTGAVVNGSVVAGDSYTFKSNGTNWYAI